jgi:HD-GYP domain-containing protein (c-di-GMP phosphodiesterase class II)
MTYRHGRLRLTELLASLSLATDLGTGQPLGHGLRTSLVAVRLAREMGLGDDDVRTVQQVSLLRFLGCTADAAETAQMAGGDEVAFNAAFAPVLNGTQLEALRTMARAVGSGKPFLTKGRMLLAAVTDPKEPSRGLAAHCEVAAMLARRLGLGERVTSGLLAAYERWDGNGYPAGLEGEAIPIEIRIGMVARDVDVFVAHGRDVQEALERRRGGAYDPTVVDAFGRLGVPHPEADWDEVLDSEPVPFGYVDDLDTALAVMADFVDLKSPWTRGHSREVAGLAENAARELGLGSGDADRLRRAGLVHDLGRVGIPNGIWDKPGPLSTDEWEKVRLHPYLTDRILSRCPELATLGALASNHHERLDASGYHRQSTADHLPIEARLLAAADVLAALMSARPHRDPFDIYAASDLMREEVRRGRLDKDAVECVIAAAGGKAEAPGSPNPDGLTDREVEVLRQLCRGLTNRQIGVELFISPKTVGRHVENIYTKIGVSTRPGATVYAMERRLLD